MISLLLQLVLGVMPPGVLADSSHPCHDAPEGRVVPTEFAAGRIFAVWHLTDQRELQLYTDTGGGTISLYPDAVQRIGVAVDTSTWTRGTAHGTRRVALVPISDGDPDFPPIRTQDSLSFQFLVEDQSPPEDEADVRWDGRLGAFWFLHGVWTFDYPAERLLFNGTAPTGPSDPACWVPLGFKTDSAGRRSNIFPRIEATIDGEAVQFLLDTGARTEVTREAWPRVEPQVPRHRATSFIGTTLFQKWRARHPEWLVVPHAEVGTDSSAMIRVPAITVGSVTFGPVWFTERPTSAFPAFMSQYTDRPVQGALGGSAWQYGTLIVDYPRSRATVLMSDHR